MNFTLLKNKKLLFSILGLLIQLYAFAFDFKADGLYFELLSLPNRTCKLTSGTDTYSGALTIPETIDYEGLTFNVVELDPQAFNSKITELTIPSSISTIPANSITKCNLKKLIFKDGVNPLKVDDFIYKSGEIFGPTYGQPLQYLYIGRTLTNHSSFSYSSSLTELIIGPHVTDMPYLFGSNKIEQIFIPDNIVNLQGDGLAKCLGLKNVFIGNGVSKIPNEFLFGNTSLENVYLGNNISEIGVAAFHNCTNLTNLFIFSDKLTKIANNTSDGINYCLPSSIATIYVPNPKRYDNLLNGYYRENLIAINNTSTEYSGKAPNFSFRNNVTGATISFLSENLDYSVGTYNTPVNVIFSFQNGWSSSSEVMATYSISAAPLTVLANDVSRIYGNENPELTCSFFGFKNGETTDALTRLPNVETTATLTSNVGVYPIIPSGAEAHNYIFNYERGSLTITKADQEIEWEQQFGTVNVGDIVELTASSSAGLSIKYISTDESIAYIFTQGSKKYVEFLKPGNVVIRATQEGTENYNEADRVSKAITVGAHVTEITLNHNSVTLAEGNTLQLIASIIPVDALNKSLSWESTNPEIATVDANGKVIAILQGSTIITARSTDGSNKSASCTITVIKPVSSIYISQTNISMKIGEQTTLIAYAIPSNATNSTLNWYSEDDMIAKVDGGVVTAIGRGSTYIVVESTDGSNIIEKCKIEVGEQSDIDSISSDLDVVNVHTSNGDILIENVPIGHTAYVFLTNGTLVKKEESIGNTIIVQPITNDIYIIVIDNQIYKIIIR